MLEYFVGENIKRYTVTCKWNCVINTVYSQLLVIQSSVALWVPYTLCTIYLTLICGKIAQQHAITMSNPTLNDNLTPSIQQLRTKRTMLKRSISVEELHTNNKVNPKRRRREKPKSKVSVSEHQIAHPSDPTASTTSTTNTDSVYDEIFDAVIS